MSLPEVFILHLFVGFRFVFAEVLLAVTGDVGLVPIGRGPPNLRSIEEPRDLRAGRRVCASHVCLLSHFILLSVPVLLKN